MKCKVCGKPAKHIIAGHNSCDDCFGIIACYRRSEVSFRIRYNNMGLGLEIMLAINDRNGNIDSLTRMEIDDDNIVQSYADKGEVVVYLERNDHFETGKFICINDMRLKIRECRKFVGNIHWDCVTMNEVERNKLLNYIRKLNHWQVEEGTDEFYKKWKEGF